MTAVALPAPVQDRAPTSLGRLCWRAFLTSFAGGFLLITTVGPRTAVAALILSIALVAVFPDPSPRRR